MRQGTKKITCQEALHSIIHLWWNLLRGPLQLHYQEQQPICLLNSPGNCHLLLQQILLLPDLMNCRNFSDLLQQPPYVLMPRRRCLGLSSRGRFCFFWFRIVALFGHLSNILSGNIKGAIGTARSSGRQHALVSRITRTSIPRHCLLGFDCVGNPVAVEASSKSTPASLLGKCSK